MRKNFSFTLLLSAAILTLGAAVVSGQDRVYSAKIPFAFSLNGSNLPAGQYTVGWLLNNQKVMRFRNVESGETAFALIRNFTESKGDGSRLVFYCAGLDCSLAEVSFGAGRGWEFSQPNAKHGDRGHEATIYLDQNGQKINRIAQ